MGGRARSRSGQPKGSAQAEVYDPNGLRKEAVGLQADESDRQCWRLRTVDLKKNDVALLTVVVYKSP